MDNHTLETGQRLYEGHVAHVTVHAPPRHQPNNPPWADLPADTKAYWAALERNDPRHRRAEAEERKAMAMEHIDATLTGLAPLFDILKKEHENEQRGQ